MAEQFARLGVALSGGGVRASLFSLGAILYLVDSRCSERVTEVTSVSGGSITNGFVAQRCDLSKVSASQFDKYASQLIRAVTSGLVSKRRVIGIFGAVSAVVVAITVFSWPVDLPSVVDAALYFSLLLLVLFRGVLLAHLFQRRLFGLGAVPTTLGEIKSSVAHYFCATDLNACMPIYFTNVGVHFYSPAWGRAAADRAAGIRIVDAVRSSAAFPGGVPPKRINVRDFGLSPTPFHRLRRWQQLAFQQIDAAGAKPTVLYLVDGGVWNNLGTDWFEMQTGFLVLTADDRQPRARERLIVDATAPTPAKLHLDWFWVPGISEVLALFRAWLVSYTSSVAARIERLDDATGKHPGDGAFKYAAEDSMNGDARPDRARSLFVARMVDPLKGGIHLGRLVWLGEPGHWAGRWNAVSRLRRLLHADIPTSEPVVRDFDVVHQWTSRVPTTLFSIPPETALLLLAHGYLSTAQAIAGDYRAGFEFPGVERFARLIGLEVHAIPNTNAIFLGSEAAFKKRYEAIFSAAVAGMFAAMTRGLQLGQVSVDTAEGMRAEGLEVIRQLDHSDEST